MEVPAKLSFTSFLGKLAMLVTGAILAGVGSYIFSDPKPAWVISESSFTLTGDRQCNAWSECRQSTNEPANVCWQFRMQGHKEQTGGLFNQGNTGIRFSTGVLSVLWRKET